jgi:hypothetical protein
VRGRSAVFFSTAPSTFRVFESRSMTSTSGRVVGSAGAAGVPAFVSLGSGHRML